MIHWTGNGQSMLTADERALVEKTSTQQAWFVHAGVITRVGRQLFLDGVHEMGLISADPVGVDKMERWADRREAVAKQGKED